MLDRTLLSRDLPGAVRLSHAIDAALMCRDLASVNGTEWRPEEPYRFEGFFGSETKVYHNGEWAGLSLRSQGGRFDRTDPGGPGLEEFQDTTLMERTPYIGSVLRELNAPLRSVRLLRLPAGGNIAEHRDTYHGFEYGQLRLHVPIVTNDRVSTIIRGERWHWAPGELWYGDFGSPHAVHNEGDASRVHLVVDVLITPDVLKMFPDSAGVGAVDTLFDEAPIRVTPESLRRLGCRFRVPSTLVRGIFDVDDGIVGQMEACFRPDDTGLIWTLDGRDIVKLVPLRDNRLGFLGWTMERCFEYVLEDGRIAQLDLVLRHGHEATRIALHLS